MWRRKCLVCSPQVVIALASAETVIARGVYAHPEQAALAVLLEMDAASLERKRDAAAFSASIGFTVHALLRHQCKRFSFQGSRARRGGRSRRFGDDVQRHHGRAGSGRVDRQRGAGRVVGTHADIATSLDACCCGC